MEACLAVGGGFAVGLGAGLVGLAGFAPLLPLLETGLRVPGRRLVGTVVAVLVPAAIAGVLIHLRNGRLQGRTGLVLGVAGALGVAVAATAVLRVPVQVPLRILGVFLLISGLLSWPWSALRRPIRGGGAGS